MNNVYILYGACIIATLNGSDTAQQKFASLYHAFYGISQIEPAHLITNQQPSTDLMSTWTTLVSQAGTAVNAYNTTHALSLNTLQEQSAAIVEIMHQLHHIYITDHSISDTITSSLGSLGHTSTAHSSSDHLDHSNSLIDGMTQSAFDSLNTTQQTALLIGSLEQIMNNLITQYGASWKTKLVHLKRRATITSGIKNYLTRHHFSHNHLLNNTIDILSLMLIAQCESLISYYAHHS